MLPTPPLPLPFFLSFKVCGIQVKNTGKMYACKKLDKKLLKKKHGEQRALSEKESLETISSPFLVSLACAFESKSHLCLVMSLMNGGDLRFHAYSAGTRGLATSRVVFYSAQMPCGVLHLHSLAIVCWDLKPENVLLDDLGHCRLSDLAGRADPRGQTCHPEGEWLSICLKGGTQSQRGGESAVLFPGKTEPWMYFF